MNDRLRADVLLSRVGEWLNQVWQLVSARKRDHSQRSKICLSLLEHVFVVRQLVIIKLWPKCKSSFIGLWKHLHVFWLCFQIRHSPVLKRPRGTMTSLHFLAISFVSSSVCCPRGCGGHIM